MSKIQFRLVMILFAAFTCNSLYGQRHGDPEKLWQERYPQQIQKLQAMTEIPLRDWRFHDADIPHGEEMSLDDSSWNTVHVVFTGRRGNDASASTEQRGWYRAEFVVPQTVGGKDTRGAKLKLTVRFSRDGRIFLNGGLVAQGDGRTLDPIVIAQSAEPGQHIQIAIKTPFHEPAGRLLGATVMVEYPGHTDPGFLRSEIQTAEALISGFEESKAEHQQQLDAAVASIDFSSLDKGDQAAFSTSLDTAQKNLQPLNQWMKQFTVRFVGNAHIDMAWLWPWTETVEVVRDTFRTALQLMDEYPEFKYTQSSVQDFAWMEDKYPAEFQEIQKRVKEGRWELVGGMWVEPDLNMPDGESLVRQILLGKRYFQQKFNTDVNIGWNPDSFGYSWQLPQIYKRSGIDSFVTQKMSWNESTVFPYKLFWWQAPDGSKVLTYFPHNYSGTTEPVGLANDVAAYAPATHFPEIMQLYGVGDHGGGPTRQEVDQAVRLIQPSTVFPKAEFSTAKDFFADVHHALDGGLNLPTWDNELYLEYHRGCYTTQSETKKQVRHNEEQVENAEKFAALSFLETKAPYPGSDFESIWKKVLFNDFHDILPGSGVQNNYVEALATLHDADLASTSILNRSLKSISQKIDTAGQGTPFIVFNPLSWKRSEPVILEAHTPENGRELQALDAHGKPLLSQVLSKNDAAQTTKLAVTVADVPPLGYSVIHLAAVPRAKAVASALKVDGSTIENEFFRMKVDMHTGCITSLVNKSSNKETVAPGGCGGLLQTFVDLPPVQDAWEIKFDDKSWDLKDPEEVKIAESGPEEVVVRIHNKFQNSDIVREMVVRAGVPRIDVRTRVDWHESHILLKVGFAVNAQATKATFEIPYGTIERPTTRNTLAEKAMFEVPAQRWGDISDAKLGFSLLNASKYGYDAKDNVIRLSLLRSPSMPAPDGRIADQGVHEFTYSLFPHGSGWQDAGTMRQGYELNYPLAVVEVAPHGGSLPAEHSFVSVEPRNVILTALKKAEDSDALIFRLYEFEGKPAEVHLHLPEASAHVAETNLMEAAERDIPVQNGRDITFQIQPYEIQTVSASFGSAQ